MLPVRKNCHDMLTYHRLTNIRSAEQTVAIVPAWVNIAPLGKPLNGKQ